MEKFMSGLADMMSGPQLDGDEGMDIDQEQERKEDSQDMNAFRESLIKQSRWSNKSSGVVYFDGLALGFCCNIAVEYAPQSTRCSYR